MAKELVKGSLGCSFLCSSLLLGVILKEMHSWKLSFIHPSVPFTGLSVAYVLTCLRTMHSPPYCPVDRRRDLTLDCSLESYLMPVIDRLESAVVGLPAEAYMPVVREI